MDTAISKNLQRWLDSLADTWNTTIEQVVLLIDIEDQEILNRERYYPGISALLRTKEWKVDQLAEIARKCYVLGYSFDAIRFNNFVSTGQKAEEAVHEFVDNFPVQEAEISVRINNFITKAVEIAYTTPQKTFDFAGAATLCSLLLTALYPERFVDFRQKRWTEFANLLDYHLPEKRDTYGEKLIWAGQFAYEIVKTDTFVKYWPGHKHPLWVVAGLCWHSPQPKKPKLELLDERNIDFPEGRLKAKLHFSHERNKTLVNLAKKRAFEQDPFLRCEVCGFSFREVYGEMGINVIEAHHTEPIASLSPGSRTRLEDIALLCSNCHRMIHANSEGMLTISELSDLLKKPRI